MAQQPQVLPTIDAVDVVGRDPHCKLSSHALMCLSLRRPPGLSVACAAESPKLPSPVWQVPVCAISAPEGKGVAEVWDDVARFRATLEATGASVQRRRDQARAALWSEIDASDRALPLPVSAARPMGFSSFPRKK
jgi:Methylmalonyl Co-A mutase-associated GTPase MeaB